MPRVSAVALALATWFSTFATGAERYSVSSGQLDSTKIYMGSAARFSKPAEVDFQRVFEATPEHQEIKRKKIERGTGKYWLLASQGTDHAIKAIAQVAKDARYDFVAAEGCLAALKPPIPADDITDLVVEAIAGKVKKADAKEKTDKESRELQAETEQENTQSEQEQKTDKVGDQPEGSKNVDKAGNKQQPKGK